MRFTKQEKQEIINMFLRACKIDNPSGKEEKIANWVLQELEPLKMQTQIDEYNNVFFHLPGKGRPIFLSAHLDSVQPCENKVPHFDGKTFYSTSDTILGADNLEGVTAILSAINYLKRHNLDHRPLDIVLSSGEEIGGIGMKNFDFSNLSSKEGIVLDGASPIGSIVLKSPAKYNFQILVHGVSGHSGHSRKAFSAIKALAEIVYRLPIGKIRTDTRLNLGRIEGGKAINTIPGIAQVNGFVHAFGDGEIRGENKGCERIIDLIEREIKRIEKKYSKIKTEFTFEIVRYEYELSPTDPFIEEVEEITKKSKARPRKIQSFGTSDANVMNSLGCKGVLIGTGAKNLHTTEESLSLKDLLKLIEITINLCKVTK